MNATELLSVFFLFQILTSETIAWEANSLSSPVITRNHRRLRGSTFSSFHSISLALCGLRCQRHPRCDSTNFIKVSFLNEEEGVCELNDCGVKLSVEENDDLEYEEGAVYMQLRDIRVRKNITTQFLTREEYVNLKYTRRRCIVQRSISTSPGTEFKNTKHFCLFIGVF